MIHRNGDYTLRSLDLKISEEELFLMPGVSLTPECPISSGFLKELGELVGKINDNPAEPQKTNSGWRELFDDSIPHGFYHLFAFGIGPIGHFSFMIYSEDLKTYECYLSLSEKVRDPIQIFRGGETDGR